jgi:hypothetical protein
MKRINQSGLAIVFGNREPRREGEYPSTWLLLTGDRVLRVVVTHDAETRPHVIWKAAA